MAGFAIDAEDRGRKTTACVEAYTSWGENILDFQTDLAGELGEEVEYCWWPCESCWICAGPDRAVSVDICRSESGPDGGRASVKGSVALSIVLRCCIVYLFVSS